MRVITRHMQDELLASGIRLIIDPFGSSDTISVAMSFAGGRNLEKKPLVAALTSAMLGEGTKSRSKKEIQVFLDSIGANREYEGLGDRIEVSGKVRRQHLKEFLELLSEEIREPRLDPRELTLLKKRAEGSLKRDFQDTRKRAEIAFSRILYATGHPNWERDIDELRSALSKATVADLREHHARCIGSGSLVVALSGAVTHENSAPLVGQLFGRLKRGAALPLHKAESPRPRRRTELVEVPHKASIDYIVGVRVGITHKHADFNPLLLGLRVLGNPGGFKGRLMQVIREKEGLTYGVYSFLKGFGDAVDGHAMVWGTFAPSLFRKGRNGILREVRRLVQRGVTQQELRVHKQMLSDGWHVRLSSTEARASAILDVIHDDLPLTYLDTFPEVVAKLSRARVNAVLRKYLKVAKLSEVAAGPVDSMTLKP